MMAVKKKTVALAIPASETRTWFVYRCVYHDCEHKGGTWPVAGDEPASERRCPDCEMPGRKASEHVDGTTRILEGVPEPAKPRTK